MSMGDRQGGERRRVCERKSHYAVDFAMMSNVQSIMEIWEKEPLGIYSDLRISFSHNLYIKSTLKKLPLDHRFSTILLTYKIQMQTKLKLI